MSSIIAKDYCVPVIDDNILSLDFASCFHDRKMTNIISAKILFYRGFYHDKHSNIHIQYPARYLCTMTIQSPCKSSTSHDY